STRPTASQDSGCNYLSLARLAGRGRFLPSRACLPAPFWLSINVPGNSEITSLTGIADHGPAVFRTTHWSVVLTAQDDSPAAHEALEKLCRTYWRPIYGFVRRQGVGPEEAEDLTQGFFALLLERRDFDTVRKEKGR